MKPETTRRRVHDRREQELGPPKGWRERRKSVERRLPDVVEIPFSEWLARFPVSAKKLRELA